MERLINSMMENGSKIIKELLNEYFARLLKLLQEPKVMAHREHPDMQEILGKTSALLQYECLRFDDYD